MTEAIKLKWSETIPVNEDVRYHHVIAKTPLGRVVIAWKDHKEIKMYDVMEAPLLEDNLERYGPGFFTLEKAKEHAEKAYMDLLQAAAVDLDMVLVNIASLDHVTPR